MHPLLISISFELLRAMFNWKLTPSQFKKEIDCQLNGQWIYHMRSSKWDKGIALNHKVVDCSNHCNPPFSVYIHAHFASCPMAILTTDFEVGKKRGNATPNRMKILIKHQNLPSLHSIFHSCYIFDMTGEHIHNRIISFNSKKKKENTYRHALGRSLLLSASAEGVHLHGASSCGTMKKKKAV